MQPDTWLPLTEYALRSGMSISTLRRKIKSNAVDYKMEEGRYLIRFDELEEEAPMGFTSTDAPRAAPVAKAEPVLPPPPTPKTTTTILPTVSASAPESFQTELKKIREEMSLSRDEGSLRWRALEARVAGLAKKLEQFTEQMAELKMLVKIFEEKLDGRS